MLLLLLLLILLQPAHAFGPFFVLPPMPCGRREVGGLGVDCGNQGVVISYD